MSGSREKLCDELAAGEVMLNGPGSVATELGALTSDARLNATVNDVSAALAFGNDAVYQMSPRNSFLLMGEDVEVPWDLVGEAASQILLRVDGSTCASKLADHVALPIARVAEQLERLVGLGLVYIVTPSLPACDPEGEGGLSEQG
ncbi:MAG TPA: hypothetical protein VF765_37015 [Polyangiaceae bacterium]